MAKPTSQVTFFWPGTSNQSIASAQTLTSSPLVLNYTDTSTSPFIGTYVEIPGLGPKGTQTVFQPQVTQSVAMPEYNLRNVSVRVASASSVSGHVTINGLDVNGDPLTENISLVLNAATYGVNFYSAITSVLPANATIGGGGTISIGFGTSGCFTWFECDTWNKNAQYSIEYINITDPINITTVGTLNLYDAGPGIPDNQLYITETTGMLGNATNLPIENTKAVYVEPSVTAFPFTAGDPIMVNFSIPYAGLTSVMNNMTGSFTQIILQQGGLV